MMEFTKRPSPSPWWTRPRDALEAEACGEFQDQGDNVKKYTLKAANHRAADRPAWGWPPEGRIIMTP
jgi:hypothetical protein